MPLQTQTFAGGGLNPVVLLPNAEFAVNLGPNLTLAQGTVMAQSTTDGKFYPYADGGANGLGTARGVLKYACKTNAAGRVSMGDEAVMDAGQTLATATIYVMGAFKRSDFTGLTATAQGQLGRWVTGTITASNAEDIFFVR